MHNFFSKFKLKNKYIIIISKIKQFKTHNFLKGIQAVRIEFFVYIKSCHYSMLYTKAKIKMCVFTVTCQINLGSVGLHFFFTIDKIGNSRSRFRNPIFHF